MKNKLKECIIYIAAGLFIVTGILCGAYYISNEVTIVSTIIGLIGGGILSPLLKHYVESIKEIIK